MKKKLFFILIGLLLTAGILLLFINYSHRSGKNKIINLKICDEIFSVEVADTEYTRKIGLSKRESLGGKEGMLFLFDKSDIRYFWMKDMNFSIDIVWINGDKIVGTSENLEPAIASEKPIIYSSPTAVDKVLEIRAGVLKKTGMEIFGKTPNLYDGCGNKIKILL